MWLVEDNVSDAESLAAVFERLLESAEPFYDYQDELKNLVSNLARHGQTTAALKFCDRLRHIAGMPQLFDRVAAGELRNDVAGLPSSDGSPESKSN